MFARVEVHSGLIVMPGRSGRDAQRRLGGRVIDFIVEAARAARETPADFLVNRIVETDEEGSCSVHHLPDP